MNSFFAPGREFSLVEKMFGADRFVRDAKGLGDDAFLWEPQPGVRWVITADASAEETHYRLDWTSPESALRKALLANLSDINAMGGRSRHAFLNLGARPEWDETIFESLGKTLRDLEAAFGFQISGGDTIKTSGASFFAFTVIGEVTDRVLLRSACKPGHKIYVSGDLGASSGGLHLLKNGIASSETAKTKEALIAAHLSPKPPLELGPLLGSFEKETAAIDISDGLSSELWHLSRQSKCSLRIDWEKLPVNANLKGFDEKQIRDFVLNGGEEYQLLFTGDFSGEELRSLRAVTPITEIGGVSEGEGVLLSERGVTSPLLPGGFSHG